MAVLGMQINILILFFFQFTTLILRVYKQQTNKQIFLEKNKRTLFLEI